MLSQPIERFGPKPTIVVHPIVEFLKRRGAEAAGTTLCRAAARDEPSSLEHLQVLGDGGQTQVERLCQLVDRFLARRKLSQDGPPRRIGKDGERAGERVLLFHDGGAI